MTSVKISEVYQSQAEPPYGATNTDDDSDTAGILYNGSLIVGNAKMGQDPEFLKRFNIEAHLTVGTDTLSSKEHISYLAFPNVLDLPETNLFSVWTSALPFISTNFNKKKNVFVSCVYGQSRSVACVIAFIMQQERIPWIEAYNLVKSARKNIHVNLGFLYQLALWEDMQYIFIGTSPAHAQCRWSVAVATGSRAIDFFPASTSDGCCYSYYRCKKCRFILFEDWNIIDVTNYYYQWINSSSTSTNTKSKEFQYDPCHTISIELVEWMMNSKQGKLLCPKCNSKVGSFNHQSSNNAACQITLSRVEKSRQ